MFNDENKKRDFWNFMKHWLSSHGRQAWATHTYDTMFVRFELNLKLTSWQNLRQQTTRRKVTNYELLQTEVVELRSYKPTVDGLRKAMLWCEEHEEDKINDWMETCKNFSHESQLTVHMKNKKG